MTSFKDRIINAARLDARLYEEVEGDENALTQAMSVVILSSLAAGVGSITKGGMIGVIAGTITAIAGWFFWAYLTYLIGTKLLPQSQTKSSLGEMLRTTGFSSAPGMIRVAGIIPGFTGIVFFIASVWMLIAMVIGVRQALDYTSTLRAVGVCIIGWIVQVIIMGILFLLLGNPMRTV
ncbi:MAG: YIP1 family protein [Alphaproteobacteria bacterium]|uniref:YIP1 family protein n=1 Tax=Candidatus Nitrobium versatile TaxID=2884831 RepID=A0A953JAR3_9BACT|nr:YIP1 family protein [Candidatus Nitrobium versatile]